ncbi:MAG TPA: FAD/NAD(P)-binding protein [Candidatus Manganitrophaceae bacterium]|nr:FAD/NAD(P)-binding protein [Candidatus Manganitrophaceae bacterium]
MNRSDAVFHPAPPQDPFIPHPADIVEKRREARGIYTYRLRFQEEALRRAFQFQPGQFNMVYAFGAGEVPISIVSDPGDPELLDHTIRIVGNVTGALDRLEAGDAVGLRGPYGSAWPLQEAEGKEVVIITGGLGCAPVVSVINYIARRRASYGPLKILHGIKTPKDLLYRERFRAWRRYPDTEVYLTVDHPDRQWKYSVGVVTNLFSQVKIDAANGLFMMCGPEVMMRYAAHDLLAHGVSPHRIYLSLERNMKCAVAFCGHCQFGPTFVCREGPVYRYDRIQEWFEKREI